MNLHQKIVFNIIRKYCSEDVTKQILLEILSGFNINIRKLPCIMTKQEIMENDNRITELKNKIGEYHAK